MTGAVTVSAVVGLLSLFAGVALGWYLRRTNDWCPTCGEQLSCGACKMPINWSEQQSSTAQRSPV
ncbi:hypothetical protein FHR83_005973 [Actinoplanes campanulatus]|uniref:Uncharacterized protein n=1 Tax=Actinoplanes campanulatus TaxID=113559 RepID=A0A7W5AL47_9ACTN|nr:MULTISPECIES: hypothetical protein [Actinoplanes]MBB3098278.1 hypothetical protein [Actinoplanes campanulatus]GID47593.1 hypothetical protein Aca07nite_48680 [Actinoplanes capillaceus]